MKFFGAGKVLFAATALAMGTLAWGQGPEQMGPPMMGPHRPPMERSFEGPGPFGRWWNSPKMIEKLKLTDDQRKAFDQILDEHKAKLIDLRANLEKAELPMHSLMDAEQPDEAKILAQIDKTVQARAELEKANARFLLALRSKLTPDQWKQMKEMRESHPPMPQDGPGERRHEGQGKVKGGMVPPPGPQGMLDDDNGPAGAPDAAPAGAPAPGAVQ
ncbi:MAG TPA: Spy/CpxP family protein refolding chaperone [Terracidiphilus sp.]|nr:Spy/CpxP family protein refolding chaperone [Terracidiphilus sp.]